MTGTEVTLDAAPQVETEPTLSPSYASSSRTPKGLYSSHRGAHPCLLVLYSQQPGQGPSRDKMQTTRKQKYANVNSRIFFSVKKNEMLVIARKWMELENEISELSHSLKDILLCSLSYIDAKVEGMCV